MKKLLLALVLMGCGTSKETESGIISLGVELDSGHVCTGHMALAFLETAPDADVAVNGSWRCDNYGGEITGTWPHGDPPMTLILATERGDTATAHARFEWSGLVGTIHLAGADVPLRGTY